VEAVRYFEASANFDPVYTVCPGSVRTESIEFTRSELFSKFHSSYSKQFSFVELPFKTAVHSLWMSWIVS
jgi:hypothetical protein